MNTSNDELNASQALDRKRRYKHLIDENRRIGKLMQEPEIRTVDTLRHMQQLIQQSDDVIGEGNVTERAEHTTEVVLDAQLLHDISGLLSKVMQQSSLSTCFTDQMYQRAILQRITRADSDDWSEITNMACRLAYTARGKSTMLGAVTVEPKVRVVKERQARKKATQTEEQRPETIDKLQRRDKGAEKVNIVHKQLKEIFRRNSNQPIPFYKLVIDPRNFMNTVENAFQIAFLVRDNQIAIETGDDSYPHVRLLHAEDRNSKKENTQSICALSLKTCEEMILFYEIKEPMLIVSRDEDDA